MEWNNITWLKIFDVKYLILLFILGMVHISNNHHAMNQMRDLNKYGRELKELRWEFLTTKSDLMNRSKQSEVSKAVEPMGLKELVSPPYKILVKEEEYKVDN